MSLVARLIFKADGAAQVKREADEVASSVKRAGGKTEQANRRSAHSFGMITSALGFVGVAAGADFVKNMVTGALSVQAAQTQAQNALRTTGLTAQQQGAALKQYNAIAVSASEHGGGTKAEEITALARLTSLTGNNTKAVQANAAVNKLAVGANIDYQTALQAVAGAEAGRFRGLQRYLPLVAPVKTAEQELATAHGLNTLQIDAEAKAMGKAGPAWKQQQLLAAGITKAQQAQAATADKNATAQMMLAQVSQKYGHSQESMKQKIQDARHSFQNLTDDLGKALLPTIVKLIGVGDDFARFLAKHKAIVVALAVAVIALGTGALAGKLMSGIRAAKAGFLDLGKAIGIFTVESEADMEAVSFSMRGALVASGIGIVIVALGLMVTHWQTTKRIIMAVLVAIGAALVAAARAITTAFTAVAHFVTGAFHAIGNVVSTVVHTIENVFKKVFDFLTFPIRKAIGWVKQNAQYLNPLHWLGKAAGFVGNVLGSIGLAHGGPVYRAGGGPSGSDTVPAWLTPGEFVMPKHTVQAVGVPALQHLASTGATASQQPIVIHPAPVQIRLDQRVIAEGVIQFALKRAARGTSSTVGGPAIMGLGSA